MQIIFTKKVPNVGGLFEIYFYFWAGLFKAGLR